MTTKRTQKKSKSKAKTGKKTKRKAAKSAGIGAYLQSQKPEYAAIGRRLKKEIAAALPRAKLKMYHSIPVWFIGENAIVGFYASAKKGMNLLFWNGQALKEPALKATGSFKAAEIQFRELAEIESKHLRRWLKKAGRDIWDFAGLRRNASK